MKISKNEWQDAPKFCRSTIGGQKYLMGLDAKTGGTKLTPVVIKTREEEIIDMTKKANQVAIDEGWERIIVASKLNKRSKRERFGFFFRKIGEYKVGDIIQHEDSSIAKVEAISI